jgi:hypothetical protein
MSDKSTEEKLAQARLELAAALDAAHDRPAPEAADASPRPTIPRGRVLSAPAADAAAYGPNAYPHPNFNPGAPAESDVHLLDYVKVLYKRRWTAAPRFSSCCSAWSSTRSRRRRSSRRDRGC